MRVLFALLLALLMTLALVGVKKMVVGSHTGTPATVAEGGMPPPPIPW
jgi:hypothetical protein